MARRRSDAARIGLRVGRGAALGEEAPACFCRLSGSESLSSVSKSRRPDEVFPFAPVNMLILAPVRDPPVIYFDQGDTMVTMSSVIGILNSHNLPLYVERCRPPCCSMILPIDSLIRHRQ